MTAQSPTASTQPRPRQAPPGWLLRLRRALPGLAVAVGIALVATWLGSLLPVVGGPVFGIVLGVLIAALLHRGLGARAQAVNPGAAVASKVLLQVSVVLLGTGLSLGDLGRTGLSSLPVMLGTLAVALVGAWLLGRALGLGGDTRTLIGVGTGICGASAIAAATAVIGAAEGEVAYAIATIFTFNVAAVLIFPALGHLLGLSQPAFGLWAGTAINDTSSVVAAATTYGPVAADDAVIVKLTRSLMILPICIVLAVLVQRRRRRESRRGAGEGRLPWRRVIPPFLVGFVLASVLNSFGAIPAGWHPGLRIASVFLITVALTGIGLITRPAALRAAGHRPLLLGGILWVAVAGTSLLLQLATGTL